ncbi:alpha/beta hydrolase [Nocardia sp. NPDC056000]
MSASMLKLANSCEKAMAVVPAPRGTRIQRVRFPDFRAEWLWHNTHSDPSCVDQSVVLYFHGGVFLAGGLHSHRRLAARIARAAALPVFNVDYRLLPTAGFGDIVEDALTAYRYLLERGFAPARILLGGDSAGAGLAFSLALAARELGLPMPGAIAAIAPWADYNPVGRRADDSRDAVLSTATLAVPVAVHAERYGALQDIRSPLDHEFHCLPPILIQVGSDEVLRHDAELLASRCARSNVVCTLQVWDRAIHDFHLAADMLPDARAAIREIAEFYRSIDEPDRRRARGRRI